MNGDGAENLIKQGDQLSKIGDVCRELGVTFILLHHNKKARSKSFEPPTMEDLAWAGFSEFARQWWLLGRREAFVPGSGEHKLHFVVGGSAGHSAHHHLNINEGSITTGRVWKVEVEDASVSFADGKRKELASYEAKILRRLANNPDGLPKTKLCEKIVRGDERDAVLNHLVSSGKILRVETVSAKANRTVIVYKGK